MFFENFCAVQEARCTQSASRAKIFAGCTRRGRVDGSFTGEWSENRRGGDARHLSGAPRAQG
jgi:hypothetical protein